MLLLAGCDEQSTIDIDKNRKATELEGTWKADEEAIIMFKGSKFVMILLDEEKNLSSKAVFNCDMNITGEKWIQPNDHRVLTTMLMPTIYTYHISYKSQEMVDNANVKQLCGYTDWKINTYQDVSLCDGTNEFDRTPIKVIFNVEDDQLRLGFLDTNDLIDSDGYTEVLQKKVLTRMKYEKEDN